MAELLTDLLAAGLIEKLEGDDERFAKMERAAQAVAQEFREHPPDLIGAILAGLDPDVPADDPAIAQAEQALLTEWKAMRSVHPSPPIGMLRAILLEACIQAAQGEDGEAAAILWLTAADTLPLVRLGREEPTVRRMLEHLAARTEGAALTIPLMPAREEQAALKLNLPALVSMPPLGKVDRGNLQREIAATVGPQYRGQPLPNANPHWPMPTRQPYAWCSEFSDRMHLVLANQLEALAKEFVKHQTEISRQLHASLAELVQTVQNALISQQRWVQDTLEASEAHQQAEQLRLNVLWWSEALYSSSMRCSYRELTPTLAAVVMAVDLLGQVTKPAPASVVHLLAEAVHRLPEAGFGCERKLPELIGALRASRDRLPKGWLDQLAVPPAKGRLSLRDLVILALQDQEWDQDGTLRRAGLTGEISLSLPILARALFRQEQAVRLAGAAK